MTTKVNTAAQTAAPALTSGVRDWLYILGITLALLGIGNAGYLTYVKLADKEVICAATATIDCNAVQNSTYSEIMGIPISVFGLGAYLTIFALFALENRVEFVTEYGKTLLFSITLFGVLYSGYLTYVEAFRLEQWCLWCVASAVTIVGLFGVSLTRLLRSMNDEDEDDA